MAIFVSQVTLKYDTDSEQFTASLEYCEPKPGLVIESAIEGEPSGDLYVALASLAQEVNQHDTEAAVA